MNIDPFQEGFSAFTSGKAKKQNPYNGPYYVPLWESWNDGWDQAARIESRRHTVFKAERDVEGNNG